MITEKYNKIITSYPMLSYLVCATTEYIGILQFCDENIITIYDYGSINSNDEKIKFLSLAEEWWWQSNRKIPINIFLKYDWDQFCHTLKVMNSKEVDIIFGHKITLTELTQKKKKKIMLIKKMH